MAPEQTQKLSLFALTTMVVGGMVGAGIFSLPRTFASATGPIGAIIAWIIAGTGMYMLARVFQSLAERKPDLDAGVFAYAKAGFGDYPGFLSAFGYWIGSCIGNVSYWVLIKSTLGAFFPVFGDGNTVVAILVASVGIWLFHFMILRGTQQAAFINSIVTVAKVVPILVFIVMLIVRLQARPVQRQPLRRRPDAAACSSRSAPPCWSRCSCSSASRAPASTRASPRNAPTSAGRRSSASSSSPTLMVLVTLLPYAVMQRADIAGMRQPSMATVLEAVVGHWGAVFVSVGLLVSVLGAYLAWSLICAEVLFTAAKTKDMPKVFARENKNKVPVTALWATNIVVQLIVITTYWSRDAFALMLNLTSAMALIPFLFVAAYGLHAHQSARDLRGAAAGTQSRPHHRRHRHRSTPIFLLYAGGMKFIVLSAVLYAPGTALYFWARREQGKPRVHQRLGLGDLHPGGHRRRRRHLVAGDRLHHHLRTERFMAQATTKSSTPFGVHSEVGQLRKVMVCAPGRAHQRLTPSNCDTLLFDDVMWVDNAKRDHFDFMQKMRDRGVDVVEMHSLLAETVRHPGGQEVDPRQPGGAQPGRARASSTRSRATSMA